MRPDSYTVLHNRLLGSGAEPDMANVQGSTPLHKACMFGQNAVVKKLVE